MTPTKSRQKSPDKGPEAEEKDDDSHNTLGFYLKESRVITGSWQVWSMNETDKGI